MDGLRMASMVALASGAGKAHCCCRRAWGPQLERVVMPCANQAVFRLVLLLVASYCLHDVSDNRSSSILEDCGMKRVEPMHGNDNATCSELLLLHLYHQRTM